MKTLALAITSACLLVACSDDTVLKPGIVPVADIRPGAVFERLAPSRTGIDFVPTVQEEFRYNFLADPYIFNGGGVAVIDLNNDGLQDLFFTARLQGCRLYLNKGGLHFEDISEAAGVARFSGLKTGVTVVDINADGFQDLYVCRTWLTPLPERRNLLLVNNGNLTFSERAAEFGLDDLSASQHANFFDYDRDGDLDCYILNHPVDFKNMNHLDFTEGAARRQSPKNEFESDRLLENTGGKFVDVTRQAGLENRAFGLSTIASDFNGDGWTDLFVGNDFAMPDFLYLNQKNGTFADSADTWFQHTSNHTMGADFADLNGDGMADLVTLDMLAESWPRRQRLMSTMSVERDRQMQERGYGRQVMRNVLQLAGGSGKFSEIGWLTGMAATDWSWAALLADYDNDGLRDLFITSGVKRDLNDLDFFHYTADSINRTGGISKERFAKFDDYSGKIPTCPSHNYLFQNNGSLQLQEVSAAAGLGESGFSNGAAYADLDNDGDLDLITNDLERAPGIYENKATAYNANRWLQVKLQGTPLNPAGVGAKLRVWSGGKLIFSQEMTPVRGFYSSVEPIFQIGLGNADKVDKIEIEWLEKRIQVLENVPANQRLFLRIADARPGESAQDKPKGLRLFEALPDRSGLHFTHQENAFEDFDREKLLPFRLSRNGPCMAAGDINGDGRQDLFIGGAAGQAGVVYLQNEQGTFRLLPQPALEQDRESEDTACAWLDADSDGDADLYVAGGGNDFPALSALYQDRLYLNDGAGRLTRSTTALPVHPQPTTCIAVHDYDADGRPDLFLGAGCVPGRYPEPAGNRVLRNMGGRFESVGEQMAPAWQTAGMIQDVQFGDLDGDGKAELVAAGDWTTPVIFQWNGAQFLPKKGLKPLENASGWWRSLALADLDGDGDLDIAAGNLGLNTRFRARDAAPMRLFAGDYDRNGSLDPLLCTPWEGAYYPVAQRDVLAAQLPVVKKKFARHTPYSLAAVQEIVDKEPLLAGRILAANTLETQWFENRNGDFVLRRLPLEAQFAPVQRMLAEDFTGDGHTDLLLLGNEWGAEPETYRLDASFGCLLAGDGKGNFQYIANRETGLWVEGMVREAICLSTANGKNVLILAINNGPIRAFWAKMKGEAAVPLQK
ncbi:MAG: VCBS repeat-containing protein [Saprospiraceae bacterium]|nr:VCBS repeat-containing protein [Saprospiraceae bacterium]